MVDYVTIPLNAVPAQNFGVVLSGLQFKVFLRQRTTGLYIDLYMSGTLILAGILCQNRTWIVREAYVGVPGDFSFIDTQGSDDPEYSGLGSRYILIYQPLS